jgi:hypothetical protein
MRSPIKTDIEGDAWVSRGNNRLRAEKCEKRILADMGGDVGEIQCRGAGVATAAATGRHAGFPGAALVVCLLFF